MTLPGLALAASLASTAIFYVVAAFVLATSRPPVPPTLPATSDLGPETPAVANLLVNGGRVTPDAVPATLFDLAARHVVSIEGDEPSAYSVRVAGQAGGELTPYEAQVLALLERRAVDGVVPAQALTPGPEDEARGWMKEFRRHVVAGGSVAGMYKKRWSGGLISLLGGLSLVAILLAAATGNGNELTTPQFIVLAIAATTFVAIGRVFRDDSLVVTPVGLAAEARWLALRHYLHDDELFGSLPPTAVAVRDRYIAYGAALGVAAAAVRAIPMGAESDRWAWTRYGGRWRQVHVTYPVFWPVAWGYSPAQAAWLAIKVGAFGAFWLWLMSKVLPFIAFGSHVDQSTRIISAAIVVIAIVALAMVAFGLWLLLVAAVATVAASTITGEAVRLRRISGRNVDLCYLALYQGAGDHVRAWVVAPAIYSTLKEYEVVTVTVSTLLGHVRSVRAASGASVGRPDTASEATG